MTKPRRKQLIIAVTAKDIQLGKRMSICACPIALSLKRRYPAMEVEVDYESIEIGRRVIHITRKMENWMARFDTGKGVTPTAFFVDAAV